MQNTFYYLLQLKYDANLEGKYDEIIIFFFIIMVLPLFFNAVHTDWIYVAGTHGLATVVAPVP